MVHCELSIAKSTWMLYTNGHTGLRQLALFSFSGSSTTISSALSVLLDAVDDSSCDSMSSVDLTKRSARLATALGLRVVVVADKGWG